MGNTSQLIAQQRIERLRFVVKTIEAFPFVHHQKDIAYNLGFDRDGTVSEHLNPGKYTVRRFTSIARQLEREYFVRMNYLFTGEGEIFDFDAVRALKRIHNGIELLKMGAKEKGIPYEQALEKNFEELVQLTGLALNDLTNKKEAKVKPLPTYTNNTEDVDLIKAAEKPSSESYHTSNKSSKDAAPSSSDTTDSNTADKIIKKGKSSK